MPARRFPPPWSIEELNDACFVVRDRDGQQLAYVYSIAANIAKLPELLGRRQTWGAR